MSGPASPEAAEGTLLELAHRYQQATEWHRRRPSLDTAGATRAPAPFSASWIADGEPGRPDLYRL